MNAQITDEEIAVLRTTFVHPYTRSAVDRLLVEVEELRAAVQRVRDLHPKTENPTHGCCAPPKLCDGHPAECRSYEHGMTCPTWPCKTLRALNGSTP